MVYLWEKWIHPERKIGMFYMKKVYCMNYIWVVWYQLMIITHVPSLIMFGWQVLTSIDAQRN